MTGGSSVVRRATSRAAIGGLFVVAACSSEPAAEPMPTVDVVGGPASTIEDYPDAVTRELARQAAAPRPVEHSAIPPRHLDDATFPDSLIPRDQIVSGGPPVDGIPAIDDPIFEPATDVDWLAPQESVMVLERAGEARAYPTQVMIWHEIVNDVVGGDPVAVTYCPLCNSGLAFLRQLDGVVLDFGTSGALYQSNLVMYDRQTESLWTQFDGRAVLGTSIGAQLDQLPLATVSWAEFVAAHPDGRVLSRDTGFERDYGRNPYNAYDQRDEPLPGFFTAEPDRTLVPFERVVGIEIDDEAVAVVRRELADVGVVGAEVGGVPVTVWHRAGMAASLNDADVTAGDDIGSVAVHRAELDGEPIDFTTVDGDIVDTGTGSTWNMLGEATAGPLTGSRLVPVPHVDTFWFSWATFHAPAQVVDVGAGST